MQDFMHEAPLLVPTQQEAMMVMCQGQQGAHDSAVCASDSNGGQIRETQLRGRLLTPGNVRAAYVMNDHAQARR